jgi:hypothetical protein
VLATVIYGVVVLAAALGTYATLTGEGGVSG